MSPNLDTPCDALGEVSAQTDLAGLVKGEQVENNSAGQY